MQITETGIRTHRDSHTGSSAGNLLLLVKCSHLVALPQPPPRPNNARKYFRIQTIHVSIYCFDPSRGVQNKQGLTGTWNPPENCELRGLEICMIHRVTRLCSFAAAFGARHTPRPKWLIRRDISVKKKNLDQFTRLAHQGDSTLAMTWEQVDLHPRCVHLDLVPVHTTQEVFKTAARMMQFHGAKFPTSQEAWALHSDIPERVFCLQHCPHPTDSADWRPQLQHLDPQPFDQFLHVVLSQEVCCAPQKTYETQVLDHNVSLQHQIFAEISFKQKHRNGRSVKNSNELWEWQRTTNIPNVLLLDRAECTSECMFHVNCSFTWQVTQRFFGTIADFHKVHRTDEVLKWKTKHHERWEHIYQSRIKRNTFGCGLFGPKADKKLLLIQSWQIYKLLYAGAELWGHGYAPESLLWPLPMSVQLQLTHVSGRTCSLENCFCPVHTTAWKRDVSLEPNWRFRSWMLVNLLRRGLQVSCSKHQISPVVWTVWFLEQEIEGQRARGSNRRHCPQHALFQQMVASPKPTIGFLTGDWVFIKQPLVSLLLPKKWKKRFVPRPQKQNLRLVQAMQRLLSLIVETELHFFLHLNHLEP